MRPLGKITNDMEKLLQEMVDEHEMQIHEILGINYAYLLSHRPEAQETYEDGTSPIFYYGPAEEPDSEDSDD